jgi:hypothetical protein
MVDVTTQRRPAQARITNGERQIGLGRQRLQLQIQPALQILDQRPGTGLSLSLSNVDCLSPDLCFDGVERSDTLHRFEGDGRLRRLMQVIKLPPHMRPAGGFPDLLAIQVMKPGIAIRLQDPLEGLQVCLWMNPGGLKSEVQHPQPA